MNASDHQVRRGLPQSIEAEQGLIGSALLDPAGVLDEATALVGPEQFYSGAHTVIWEQLAAMHGERRRIDLVTLTQRLDDRQLLDQAGGASAIADLFCSMPTSAMWREYAEIIREKKILRELIRLGATMQRRAHEEQDNVKDLLEETVSGLVELSAARGEGVEKILPVKAHAMKALDEIQYAYKTRGGIVGLPTGFADLDRMIGGWQKGYTYYIGARPAMGKTSLGMNIAEHVAAGAAEVNAPTLVCSLEMTGVQLAKRMIFTLAEINLKRARDGFLREADWDRLVTAASSVANSLLEVDETASLSIADFRARARAWVKRIRRTRGERRDGKPDGLIVIDYLQRMKGSSKRAENARYLELQEIAEGISVTAKDLQVPIIILAQLKRPKDKKPESEPDMADFRESGDIEQEAHVVALLHRPFYYVQHSLEKQQALAAKIEERFKQEAQWRGQSSDDVVFTVEDLKRYAKLLIDKQREGPVGPVDLRFIADYTKFEGWDADRALYSNNVAQRQAPAALSTAPAASVEDEEPEGSLL